MEFLSLLGDMILGFWLLVLVLPVIAIAAHIAMLPIYLFAILISKAAEASDRKADERARLSRIKK